MDLGDWRFRRRERNLLMASEGEIENHDGTRK